MLKSFANYWKELFKTFSNAWKVPELKTKLLFTLLIVVLYRIGAVIHVPFTDYEAMQANLGQAGGNNVVTPELVGINLRNAPIPDNDGNAPIDEPIINGGKTAFFSTLPVRKIAVAIENSGVPARVSYSAGAYVCNDVLYTLLARYENSKTAVGFIHVPYCKEQNKEPSLPLNDIVKALTAAINAL